MEQIYRALSEDARFKELSLEDKLAFGQTYVDMMTKRDKRFQENPEAGEFLAQSLEESIRKNNPPPEPGMFDGQLPDTPFFNGMQRFVDQTVRPEVDAMKRDLAGENPKTFGQHVEDVALHTLGIPGRVMGGLAQVPLVIAEYGLDKVGLSETGLAKWAGAAVEDLQKRNETMNILKGTINQFEPDIVAAALAGGVAGKQAFKVIHGALSKTAIKVGTPGFTATDAAITTGWTSAIGEATVAAPATMLANAYIDESGFSEETKTALRVTVPIFLGMGVGMTYENFLDTLMKNPIAVRSITNGIKTGADPKSLFTEVMGKLKVPKIKDILGDLTGGQPSKYSSQYTADNLKAEYAFDEKPISAGLGYMNDFNTQHLYSMHQYTGIEEVAELQHLKDSMNIDTLVLKTKNPQEILAWFWKNAPEPEMRILAKEMFDAVSDKMDFILVPETDPIHSSRMWDALGIYNRLDNVTFENERILIRDRSWMDSGLTPRTMMHEFLHSATLRAWHNKFRLDPNDPIITGLTKLSDHVKRVVKDKIDAGQATYDELECYLAGRLSPEEIIANAWTSKKIQQILRNIQYNEDYNALQRFVRHVKDLLGFSGEATTALEKALDYGGELVAQNRWWLPEDQVLRNQSRHSIIYGLKAAEGKTGAEASANFMKLMEEEVEKGVLSKMDYYKMSNLKTKTLEGMLFNPTDARVSHILDGLNITGKNNNNLDEWSTRFHSGEQGFVTSDFLRHTMVNAAPLMTGFNVDNEGNLKWYPEQYMIFGAPFHIWGLGGQAYRRIGVDKQLRKVGSKFSKKFWTYVNHPLVDWVHSLRPTEGMLPEIYGIKGRFRSGRNKLRRNLDQFAIDLRKRFTADELQMISDIVEREGDNWQGYAAHLHGAAKQVRKLLDDIREQLIDSGIVHEDINKLGDEYLPRIYMSKVMLKPRYQKAGKSLKRIHAKYLIRRGLNRNVAKIYTALGRDLAEVQKGEVIYSFVGERGGRIWVTADEIEKLENVRFTFGDSEQKWEIVEVGDGKVIANRDYTKGEREAMGESRDVSLRLAAFFREVSHDITMGHIFRNIADNPKLALKRPENITNKAWRQIVKDSGFKKIPDTDTASGIKKFGALSGQYVAPDVDRLLRSLTRGRFENASAEAVYGVFRGLMRPWKIGMTAFNAPTHMLNMVTNLHIAVMDGRNPLKLGMDGLYTLVKQDRFFKEAIDAGLIDSGIINAEWNLQSFADATKGLKGSSEDVPFVMQALRKASRMGTGVAKFPMRLYQWEDEVFKLGVFRAERKAGKSPEEALKIANDSFFDYSDVPRGIEVIRDTGIIPFISFSYKILPVVLRTAVDHPERMLAMMYAYNQFSNVMYDKQYGETAQAQADLEEYLRPEWQQDRFYGGGPRSQIRMKNDPETGEARTLDVSRFMPVADLFTDMTQSFPFGMNPLVSIASGLYNKKHASFGRDIMPHKEPSTDKEKFENKMAMITYISRTLTPNNPALPWSYSHDKVGNALVASGAINETDDPMMWKYAQWRGWDGKNFFGNKVNVSDTALSTIGLKVNALDVDEAVARKQTKIVRSYGKDKSELRLDLLKSKTDSEVDEAMERFDQRIKSNDQELEMLTELLEKARQ